jgi:Flp pilus assembly protein TadG
MAIIRQFLSKWRAFGAAKDGNVVMTFALATLPIVGFVGAAVDYSQANSVRTALQAALDSTALMLSKEAANLTSAQMQTKATNYFMAMFNRPQATSIVITPTYTTTGGSQVTVNGSANVPTNFMGVMGYNYLPVRGTSTVKWGSSRLRVALALDNTGSMSSSNKMTTLKTAAKSMLDQLKSAATTNGDVYVSVVPFAKDVNVGSNNYNADWVDFADHGNWEGWSSNNGSCSKKDSRNRTITVKSDCDDVNGKWTADKPSASNWEGCVTDRDQDYDVDATTPTKSKQATLFPAESYGDCPASILPMTYDWNALKNKIDAMQPAGNTNVTIGLAWAWQTLTSGAPFPAPAEDPKYKYQKVIILLTDGENTQNRFSTSQSSIDARTKKACENAKAADITLYTVLVMQGTQSLLQSCASDSSKYFYLTSASQLVTAFSTIGTALSNLRISK